MFSSVVQSGVHNSEKMNGIEYAHPSYSTFYETTETSALPFNEGNDATSTTETSCFLAPSVKVNYASELASNTERKGKLASIAKALHLKNDNLNIKVVSDDFLDFKKILLPPMLMAVNSIAYKNNSDLFDNSMSEVDLMNTLKAIQENQGASFKNDSSRYGLFKLAMDLLPSESQWYRFNQLRMHSGRPERSDEGIEKLIKYSIIIKLLKKDTFPI